MTKSRIEINLESLTAEAMADSHLLATHKGNERIGAIVSARVERRSQTRERLMQEWQVAV